MIEDLLKRKIIRDFLCLFSESKWKRLIPLTLEYGIVNLRKEANLASISLEDISLLIETTKELLEKNTKIEKEQPNREIPRNNTEQTKARSKSNNKETKPSANWRKGDSVIFKKKTANIIKNEETVSLNSDIYPKWWEIKNPKKIYSINNYEEKSSRNQELEFKNINQNNESKETKEEKKINEKPIKKKIEKKHKNEKRKKLIVDEPIRKIENPIKTELKEVESKIKSDVERDKKLYNKLKQNTKSIVNKASEYSFPRKNNLKEDSNIKIIMTSDYKIEYDKNLKPQAMREKSIERKVLASKLLNQKPVKDQVDLTQNEPLTKLSSNNNNNINSNINNNNNNNNNTNNNNNNNSNNHNNNSNNNNNSNINNNNNNNINNNINNINNNNNNDFNGSNNENLMNETEGGLSSYAPSERTKNFFMRELKDNSLDKSSNLSNSLNYSDDKINTNENRQNNTNNKKEKAVNFNNYLRKDSKDVKALN